MHAKPTHNFVLLGRDFELGDVDNYLAQIAKTERDPSMAGRIQLTAAFLGDDTPTVISRAYGIRNSELWRGLLGL